MRERKLLQLKRTIGNCSVQFTIYLDLIKINIKAFSELEMKCRCFFVEFVLSQSGNHYSFYCMKPVFCLIENY
jgi:hypothetical protein